MEKKSSSVMSHFDSHEAVVCSCGSSPFLSLLDEELSELSRIKVLHGEPHAMSCVNIRVCPVKPSSDCRGGARMVAVSASDNPFAVSVWDIETGRRVSQFLKNENSVLGLACLSSLTSDSNPLIASGNSRGVIYVTDSVTGAVACSLRTDIGERVDRLLHVPEWNQGGQSLFAASFDVLHYVVTPSELRQLGVIFETCVLGMSPSVSQNCLFTSGDKFCCMFDYRDSRDSIARMETEFSSYTCCYSEECRLFCAGMSNGAVEVWDPRQPSERLFAMNLKEKGRSPINEIVHLAGDAFVSDSGPQELAVWNVRTQKIVSRGVSPSDAVYGVCVTKDLSLREERRLSEEERIRFLRGHRLESPWSLSIIHSADHGLFCWNWILQ